MWFKYGLKAQKLLAQGSALGNYGNKLVALLIAIIPRVMPWVRSFWAFSPYLNHMRKFCYVYFYRVVFLKSDGFIPV